MIPLFTRIIFYGVVLAGVLFSLSLVDPSSVRADQAGAEFNIKEDGVKKDNIFNLFFGGAPLMPTENGTLIIDAFLDKNENRQWDEGEPPLEKAIICVVDDIEYPVPAFIPGLENGSNYSLRCTGTEYTPSLNIKSIFIKKRGEIIKIDVPCQISAPRTALNARTTE